MRLPKGRAQSLCDQGHHTSFSPPSSSSSVFEQRKREKEDFLPAIRLPIPILCQPLSSPIISAHRIAKGAAQDKKCDVWGREGCAFFRALFLQALLLLQEKGVSNLFCHLVLPHSSVLWMVYAELERESSTSSLPQETEIKIYLLDKRTKGRKKVHKTQPNRKSTERRGREGRWSSLKKKNGEWALADEGFPKPPLALPPPSQWKRGSHREEALPQKTDGGWRGGGSQSPI